MAAGFVNQGYGTLAVDLYAGKVTDNPDDAKSYMNQVVESEATETLEAWIDWLRGRDNATGAIGTVGWYFGGGWSLNALMARPVEATIVYYGNVDRTAEQLSALQDPVLDHFPTHGQWINAPMVDKFTAAMDEAGVYWYEADHAFASPSSSRCDKADAALSWERTVAFFDENLG
ncbi:MAG: dienelactone hydrolase family protein [Rhodospirillales bacterium]|nr:dienelactone hydrolase family protein [Rhodospirillales bacterium]